MPNDMPGHATVARYEAAYRGGDADACAACFHPDAILHSAFAAPARGRAAIAALHADWVRDEAGKTLRIVEGGSDGALAWCMIRFEEGAQTEVGWTLAVLERDSDGTWLFRALSLTEAEG